MSWFEARQTSKKRHDKHIRGCLLGHLGAVVAHGVVRSTHSQTGEGTGKDAAEDEYIGARCGTVSGGHEHTQIKPAQGEARGPDEMRPNVDRLVVKEREAQQRDTERVRGRPVPRLDIGVVAPPVLQRVPGQKERVRDTGLFFLCGVEDRCGEGGAAAATSGRGLGGRCCRLGHDERLVYVKRRSALLRWWNEHFRMSPGGSL